MANSGEASFSAARQSAMKLSRLNMTVPPLVRHLPHRPPKITVIQARRRCSKFWHNQSLARPRQAGSVRVEFDGVPVGVLDVDRQPAPPADRPDLGRLETIPETLKPLPVHVEAEVIQPSGLGIEPSRHPAETQKVGPAPTTKKDHPPVAEGHPEPEDTGVEALGRREIAGLQRKVAQAHRGG